VLVLGSVSVLELRSALVRFYRQDSLYRCKSRVLLDNDYRLGSDSLLGRVGSSAVARTQREVRMLLVATVCRLQDPESFRSARYRTRQKERASDLGITRATRRQARPLRRRLMCQRSRLHFLRHLA
tara:strand:+ start:3297 stop:3674 length:378 start_codon:yes stop_codon:yes gene_type:complete